jgi:hypothetical protein
LPPAGGPGVASHAGDPCEKEGEQGKTDEDKGSYSRTPEPTAVTRVVAEKTCTRKTAKVETVIPRRDVPLLGVLRAAGLALRELNLGRPPGRPKLDGQNSLLADRRI